MGETANEHSIYEKMTTIKSKLLNVKKGGYNKFSDYNYFELGDILPILLPALQEERLFMMTEFSATEPVAKLTILDMDFPDTFLQFETKVGSCTLKASHDVQNLGAAQTYTRRYLIMIAFDIAEADIVDAGAKPEQTPKNQQPPTKKDWKKPPANPQEKDLGQVRKEAWELIKKLPQGEQTKYISSCQGKGREELEEIIKEISAILNAPPQNAAPENLTTPNEKGHELADEALNQRLEDLTAEYYTLVETLPQETQKEWFDAGYDADEATVQNLIVKIKEKIAVLKEAKKGPPATKPAASAASDIPPDKDLEIY